MLRGRVGMGTCHLQWWDVLENVLESFWKQLDPISIDTPAISIDTWLMHLDLNRFWNQLKVGNYEK